MDACLHIPPNYTTDGGVSKGAQTRETSGCTDRRAGGRADRQNGWITWRTARSGQHPAALFWLRAC